ncbi:MAG: hypothetical protein Q4E01_00510 [Actinomycetaceae bacterium]|nr:hypothetical protein [Actinomycetaceae bacterium]
MEATDPSAQQFLSLAPEAASISVQIGNPSNPATLSDLGLDADLLEVSVLAALQRTNREVLDIVQIPGANANELLPRLLVDKIRSLNDEGLVRHWGVHARTVKQAMRAMSLLGISYVSFSASDFGLEAMPGILAAAHRARTSVIVSVSADTPAEVVADLRHNCAVLGVLIEVNSLEGLQSATATIEALQRMGVAHAVA